MAVTVSHGANFGYDMGGWPAPYGIELFIGAFGALVLVIVTGAAALSLLAARPAWTARLSCSASHFSTLPGYWCWRAWRASWSRLTPSTSSCFMEISSLASYVLIAGGPDRRALPAVFKYLIMGTIGATFYLIGIGLVYMMTGTLNLADMEARIGGVTDINPILVAAGFITIGLALKAAVFPLHVWLPNAYTHAPAHGHCISGRLRHQGGNLRTDTLSIFSCSRQTCQGTSCSFRYS